MNIQNRIKRILEAKLQPAPAVTRGRQLQSPISINSDTTEHKPVITTPHSIPKEHQVLRNA